LTKQSLKNKDWGVKYFVLTGSKLVYFHPRMKGSFKTNDSIISEEKETGTVKTTAKLKMTQSNESESIGSLNDSKDAGSTNMDDDVVPPPKFQFKVQSQSRKKPFKLGCNDEEEAKAWKNAFSDSASSSKGDEVHFEGWLYKQDPFKKTWRNRFFMIRARRVWYFEMNFRWALQLSDGKASARPANRVEPTLVTEDPDLTMKTVTGFPYRFTVSDSKVIYNLAAETETDMFGWVQDIQKACLEATSSLEVDESWFQFSDLTSVMRPPEGFVTCVFTDIQSSTKLWESASDAMNEALELHDNILRELLKLFRGYEVKTEGDAFMVAFFDPVEAILWCLQVQLTLLQSTWPQEILDHPAGQEVNDSQDTVIFKGLRVRMGAHAGYPNCRRNPVTNRMDYFGPDINLASRVASSSHGGQVVCTEEVVDSLRAAERNGSFMRNFSKYEFPVIEEMPGPYTFKGISEPIKVFQVLTPKLKERAKHFPDLKSMKTGHVPDDLGRAAVELEITGDLTAFAEDTKDDDADDHLGSESEDEKDGMSSTTRIPFGIASPHMGSSVTGLFSKEQGS
jgi:class 3 adenylate cyclase